MKGQEKKDDKGAVLILNTDGQIDTKVLKPSLHLKSETVSDSVVSRQFSMNYAVVQRLVHRTHKYPQ